MIDNIKIPARLCTCDICRYRWVSTRIAPPQFCQNRQCRSREWNGKKLPNYSKAIKLPARRKGGRPKTITLLDEDEEL